MTSAGKDVKDACFLCSGRISTKSLFTLSCCGQPVHKTCLMKRFGDLLNDQHTREYVPCPNCQQRFLIKAEVIHEDTFTEAETKSIKMTLVKYYRKATVPMTKSEIQGL